MSMQQNDDNRRAMSVQNPMTINDLMTRQQPPPRMVSVPPNLPPANRVRFSDGRSAAPQSRRAPAPEMSAADMPLDDNIGAEDEFGYELILNKNKMKKEELGTSSRPMNDELWDDAGAALPSDDFVNPRERAAFEHTNDPGPALPPMSPFRPLSNTRPQQPAMYSPIRPVQSAFGTNNWSAEPKISYEEMLEKRKKVVEGLDKFRRRGLDVRAFPPDASLDEMEAEYERHKRAVDVEASIQFSRKMLMACVTGLEYLNARYDPLGLQLEGWSESVIEDIHNYDDVFERLYDKYHSSTQMPPEFELLLMVAGSAFMFHLTNSMFKSAMPGVGNPDMMKSVRRGVMGAMSGAMSGAARGGGISGMMGGMFGGSAPSRQPQTPMGPRGSSMGGPKNGGGPPPPMNPRSRNTPPRREMRGPSGNIDEMLNNLMDREPGEISNHLVEEIDDILNHPSDDDGDRPRPIIASLPRARAGPGGSVSLHNPVDI